MRQGCEKKQCENCGELYEQRRPWQRFCCAACRKAKNKQEYQEAMRLLREKQDT